MPRIPVTVFTDPGCPFGYSASPALARLRWRFGDQLDWNLRLIGLAERQEEYEERGHTAVDTALSWRRFRRFGMPFAAEPKSRVAATSRACRAIVAVRREFPGLEWSALRALQLMHFTTPALLDDDDAVREALADVPGLDAAAIVAAIDDEAVVVDYSDDWAASRQAEGGPAEAQGKTTDTDGAVRYTAPTVVFGEGVVAGGFQPYAVYDALLANIAPDLERRRAAGDPIEAVRAFPDGITTAEVASVMTEGAGEPDLSAAEDALIEAVASQGLRRIGLGDGALWLPERRARLRLVA